jgi:hypothetical protein
MFGGRSKMYSVWYVDCVVSLLLVVIVIALAAWLWRLRVRSVRPHYGWRALWPLAVVIASLRIGALWVGNAAYRDPGSPQGWGYLLQLTGLPEIYFVRGARADPTKWLVYGSMVLAATSLAWAAVLVWAANLVGQHN